MSLKRKRKIICLYIIVILFLYLIAFIPMYYHNYNLFYDIRQFTEQTLRYRELKDRYYYTLYEDPDGKFGDMFDFFDHSDFVPMNKQEASAVLDNLTHNQAEYIYLPCAYYGDETDKYVPVYIMIIRVNQKTYGLFYLSKIDEFHMFYNFYEIAGNDGYAVPSDLEWKKSEENFSQTIRTKAINCLKSYIHTFRLWVVLIAVVLIVGGSVIILKKNKTISNSRVLRR